MTTLVLKGRTLYSDDAAVTSGTRTRLDKLVSNQYVAIGFCGQLPSIRHALQLLDYVTARLTKLQGELGGDTITLNQEDIPEGIVKNADDMLMITRNALWVGAKPTDNTGALVCTSAPMDVTRGDTGNHLYAALYLTNDDLAAAIQLVKKCSKDCLGNITTVHMDALKELPCLG